MSFLADFTKKHLIIKNRMVLVLFLFIFFYKIVFSVYSYAILRFLVESVGKDYFFIGILFAIGNFVALLIDIPLGVMQQYVRPRKFLLFSVFFLFLSNFLFLLPFPGEWVAFGAVLCYQISVEVFFVTIIAYILRISGPNDSAQNIAQSDIADNSGEMIGLAIGGIIFFLGSSMDAGNALAMTFLIIFTFLLFLFVYEFIDHSHYTKLETYIRERKLSRKILEKSSRFGDEVITIDTTQTDAISNEKLLETNPSKKKMTREMWEKSKNIFSFFGLLFLGRFKAPVLLWAMAIMAITMMWWEMFVFFEPVLMRRLYESEHSFITSHFERHLFETFMLIISALIPTFFFEVPLGKLADKWGKDRMIISGSFFAGIVMIFFFVFRSTASLLFIYILLGICIATIYPAMVGLTDEEYRKNTEQFAKTKEKTKNENAEGESAAITAIVMNIGQIAAGLFGGYLMASTKIRFIILGLGIFLAIISVISWWKLTNNKQQIKINF